MPHISKLVRLVAVLAALGWVGLTIFLFARRLFFPYDLEWMEGGMLCHSLRLLAGEPIYAPPSVDFIPYLYTPLYPLVIAGLAKIFGLGYPLARLVSVASYLGASWLGYRFCRRHGGSRAAALTAMAIPAAAYVRTGTFYDLARPDSLWLLLTTAALLALYRAARIAPGNSGDGESEREHEDEGARRKGGNRHVLAVFSALLFIAAFYAKQTASVFMVGAGVALLALDWRLVPTFGGTLAVCGLPLLWLSNRISDGWFWIYTSKLHRQHEFFAARAFWDTPIELLILVGPALLIIAWALLRRRSPALLYATWLAVVGIGASCLSFGTQWAYVNAYIPGVFFASLAIGVGAGRLVSARAGRVPRLRPAFVFALLAASLALRVHDCLFLVPGHPLALAHQDENTIRPLVPTDADRAAGDRLVARLRATKGEVLIPFHPFYAHLAGKRTYLHRMGLLDVGRAGMGAPKGLAEMIRDHRFSLAIFDNKVAGNWEMWPRLREEYREIEPSVGPPVVSGAVTQPAFALVPR